MAADLRVVECIPPERAELSRLLRSYADRAEAGELRGVGLVFATADRCLEVDWAGDSWAMLIAGCAVLQDQLLRAHRDDAP